SGLVWKRSIRKAVNGIIIPLTNINPVINNRAVVSVIFNPVIIAGNAVLSNVWFNIATKALLSITNIMVFLFLLDITFYDIIDTSPFYNIPTINFNHFKLAKQTIRFKKLMFFKKYFYENNMQIK